MSAISLADWANISTVISAMCDVLTLGQATFKTYFRKRLNDPERKGKAQILQSAFSTYSRAESRDINDRIESCRKNFMAEGNGARRRRCLCNILRHVKDGNGGTIPDPYWARTYETLGCETASGRRSQR